MNYSYKILRTAEVFFHGEVLNIFNQFQLCGCGGTVFKQRRRQRHPHRWQQRADRIEHGDAAAVQPVHADAGGERELSAGDELRPGARTGSPTPARGPSDSISV
jgi:hypothetical protein